MNSSILKNFGDHHVMIIGDVMLDRYLYGTVTRISPEAPVPVLDFERTDHRLGGAANVALNILAMRSKVSLIGLIGKDEEGEIFRRLLREANISDEWLVSEDTRKTTLKTRVMARGQHLLRVDREDRSMISRELENEILDIIRQSIRTNRPDGIILQDYNKGLLSCRIIEEAIESARSVHIPVFVDPKSEHIVSYSGCTVFKPNLQEATQILGHPVAINNRDLEMAASGLRNLLDHELTLITLSDKGLYLKRKGNEGIYVPSIPQEIADVCGAGDTVISALTLCYLSGGNDENIANLSNIAGHIACRYSGVSPVSIEQLNSEIND